MKTTTYLIIATVVLCYVLGLSALAVENEETYAVYLKVLEKLEYLTPGDSIDVRMGTEKDEYFVGEPVEIRFMASETCHIILMDIGAATKNQVTGDMEYGPISFLIPYYKLPEKQIEAGYVYSTSHDLEMRIKVAHPIGYETVNLFCSPEPLDLFSPDFTKEKIYIIQPDDTERLQKLLQQLERLEQQEWSGSSVSFLIKDPSLGTPKDLPKKFGALPPIGGTGSTGKGKFWPPLGATGTTGKQ